MNRQFFILALLLLCSCSCLGKEQNKLRTFGEQRKYELRLMFVDAITFFNGVIDKFMSLFPIVFLPNRSNTPANQNPAPPPVLPVPRPVQAPAPPVQAAAAPAPPPASPIVFSLTLEDRCRNSGFRFCPVDGMCYTPVRGRRSYRESQLDCRALIIPGGQSDLPEVTELGPVLPVDRNCIALADGAYWRQNTNQNLCSDYTLTGTSTFVLLESQDTDICDDPANVRLYYCQIRQS